jgi:hypothetical protein
MEAGYSINPTDNLVELHIRGELTVEGLIGVMRQIAADGSFRDGMHAVADLRQSSADWDYSEIQRYRDHVMRATNGRDCRWTAVVRPGRLAEVGHIVIVIAEALGARARIQMFDDPQLALRWARGDIE